VCGDVAVLVSAQGGESDNGLLRLQLLKRSSCSPNAMDFHSNGSSGRSLASRCRDAKHDTMLHPGCASHEDDNAVSWKEHNTYMLGAKKESRFVGEHLCFV
jgi:hypothetical protein